MECLRVTWSPALPESGAAGLPRTLWGVAALLAAAGDRLFQLHHTGAVWQSFETGCVGSSCPGWRELDNNAHTRAIAAGSLQP